MSQGRVVFDGTADELTADAVREIYGTDGDGNEISEAITSTSIDVRPVPAAVTARSPALLRTASASA